VKSRRNVSRRVSIAPKSGRDNTSKRVEVLPAKCHKGLKSRRV
jgi:hypothetical protein